MLSYFKKSKDKTTDAKDTPPPPSTQRCMQVGHQLYQRVWSAARLRYGLEQRWWEDTLQYRGHYDSETQQRLDENKNASKLYVNITRPRTKTMRARLIDILFPTGETNWDIKATPVPRIERALEHSDDADQYKLQKQETDRAVEEKRRADESATSMRRLMEDQLIDCDYVQAGRMAITQACRLGSGVIKGPYPTHIMRRRWQRDDTSGEWSRGSARDRRPRFSFVDLWMFYPDMDASSMNDCEYVFQLHLMSPTELRKYALTGFFDKDTVRWLLHVEPGYAPQDVGHFNDNLKYVRQLENESDETVHKRFVVFEYHGPLSHEDFKALCENFNREELLDAFSDTDDPLNQVNVTVWFSSDQVLAFDVNPLESGALPYSVFRLDPTENSIIGSHGIPRTVRDPQRSLNAAWRMVIESGGLQGVPMFVIDQSRIEPQGGSPWEIAPRRVWLSKTGFGNQDGGPPIQSVPINSNIEGLLAITSQSMRFMDDESSLPLIAQGSSDGSKAQQTAHGMTLLANSVNVIFRDAARGFDSDVTIPNMTRLYEWNMSFADDESVKGDMEVKALGSSVLLINEIVSQNMLLLINLVVSHPDVFMSLKFDEMLKVWFKTMRLDQYGLMKTDDEIERERQAAAAQPPPINPDVEAKLKIAERNSEIEMIKLQKDYEVKMNELQLRRQISEAQLKTNLEKTEMQSRAKERQFLGEAALKERHGEGI